MILLALFFFCFTFEKGIFMAGSWYNCLENYTQIREGRLINRAAFVLGIRYLTMNLTLSKKTLVTMTLACCAIIFPTCSTFLSPLYPPYSYYEREAKYGQTSGTHSWKIQNPYLNCWSQRERPKTFALFFFFVADCQQLWIGHKHRSIRQDTFAKASRPLVMS